MQVGLTTEPVVALEAAELAEEYAADRPDRDRIATYDARYVITWRLEESEHVFDTYYTIAYRLAGAVSGITFDTLERTFVEA